MSIEERLQAWASEQQARAIPVDIPVERFVTHRRWPRVLAMAGAAASVVALAVAITVVRSSGNSADRGAGFHFPPRTAQRPAPAPPGKQVVTFHGITVTVPKFWPLDAVGCGNQPKRNTAAVTDGAGASCGLVFTPGISSVAFQTLFPDETLPGTPHTLRIGGLNARRSDTTSHGESVIQIDVPRLAARITIHTPTRHQGDTLARTLELAKTDRNGCASRIEATPLDQLSGHSSSSPLVTGSPHSAVLCSYYYGYLERSRVVAASPLIDTLDNLPPGLSQDPLISPHDRQCWDFTHIQTGTTEDASSFVIRLTSHGSSLQQLYVRIGLCGKLGITNGTTTGQRTQPLIDALHPVLGGAGWPEHVKPAH